PWPALLAALLATVLGALSLPAGREWEGLSSRFERPTGGADGGPTGADLAGEDPVPPAGSAWDALSDGRDPTDDASTTT
ncbi:MAG: Trp biosynthesis-associated membrane protein, partial [Actinomycetota bacterium]|nr:Trp biosynthesis-associated membrane protein [Actinomycetota bacterium]